MPYSLIFVFFLPSDQVQNSSHSWGLSDKIAVIASIVAFLQFAALIWTVLVMIFNGRRQLRAYVAVDTVGIFEGNMVSPPQPARVNTPGIAMFIKNYGQTPAYKVVSMFRIAVIAVTDEVLSLVLPEQLEERFATTLSSGSTFNKAVWFDRPLTPNEIADIGTGVRAIYVYGRIQYVDAFKKKRISNFRLHYTGQFPPLPDAVLSISDKGNEAS